MIEDLIQKHHRLTHCSDCGSNGPSKACTNDFHRLFDDAPKVGDDIYLPTVGYLSHGHDDFQGGLCQVIRVSAGISAGEPTPFIETAEKEGTQHNWKFLKEKQAKLQEQFGNERGYPDPDDRPEFNEW